MTNRNILYRIYGDHGCLLYVGATTNPALRFEAHSRGQPWWDEAVEIKLERFDTADALITAEASAIAEEYPRYNLIGTAKPAPQAGKPRRSPGEGAIFRRSFDGMWIGSIEWPAPDGRRRQKRVSSKSREGVERKLLELKAESRTVNRGRS